MDWKSAQKELRFSDCCLHQDYESNAISSVDSDAVSAEVDEKLNLAL